MRKIFLFMMISADGYFEGPNHDISWHMVDGEFNDFAIEQTKSVDIMLFGKRTYKLMESYWPTEEALLDDGQIAKLMNETPKVVVSTTLKSVNETDLWKNITHVKEAVPKEIAKLKAGGEGLIAIFGSNTLVVSLIEHGLIDEFRIMICPLAIGDGTPLFHGLKKKLRLKLVSDRKFSNGNILLTYQPF